MARSASSQTAPRTAGNNIPSTNQSGDAPTASGRGARGVRLGACRRSKFFDEESTTYKHCKVAKLLILHTAKSISDRLLAPLALSGAQRTGIRSFLPTTFCRQLMRTPLPVGVQGPHPHGVPLAYRISGVDFTCPLRYDFANKGWADCICPTAAASCAYQGDHDATDQECPDRNRTVPPASLGFSSDGFLGLRSSRRCATRAA